MPGSDATVISSIARFRDCAEACVANAAATAAASKGAGLMLSSRSTSYRAWP
jgi:hypothetical protein